MTGFASFNIDLLFLRAYLTPNYVLETNVFVFVRQNIDLVFQGVDLQQGFLLLSSLSLHYYFFVYFAQMGLEF